MPSPLIKFGLLNELYPYAHCFRYLSDNVVHERFAPELNYEIALRLAALHLHPTTLTCTTRRVRATPST